SSRRRHTRFSRDWSSDVCSSDLALLARLLEVAAKDLAGVALERAAVEVDDVAEHPGGRADAVGPGQDLEAVRVGAGQDVRLLHAGVAVDRGAVEPYVFLERALELDRRDGEGLQLPQHVREPEADHPHAALLDRAEDVVSLALRALHGGMVGPPRPDPQP